MFSYCNIDVKKNYLEVIIHLCIVVLYGQIIEKQPIKRFTVAFYNILRRLVGLPWRCIACAMYANHDLLNLDTVIIRSLFGSIPMLSVSQNSIVRAIEQSWLVRIKLWDVWTKVLYL